MAFVRRRLLSWCRFISVRSDWNG